MDSEPVSEPVSAPEPQTVEPELVTEPQPAPEPEHQSSPGVTAGTGSPVSTSVPQPQVSTPPLIQTGLARELLVKAREMIQFRKRKKLDKIMSQFLKQASITNDEVEKLLHISDATATRYLDQLEREGKIRRVNVGKYSSYSRM